MERLIDIPIQVEYAAEAELTANVIAILHELATALDDLAQHNQQHSIDLLGLPLLDGEREALRTVMGRGEVNVQLDSLGHSQLFETQLPGVWWVRHENDQGMCIAEYLEVTQCPQILVTDLRDIKGSAAALHAQLDQQDTDTTH